MALPKHSCWNAFPFDAHRVLREIGLNPRRDPGLALDALAQVARHAGHDATLVSRHAHVLHETRVRGETRAAQTMARARHALCLGGELFFLSGATNWEAELVAVHAQALAQTRWKLPAEKGGQHAPPPENGPHDYLLTHAGWNDRIASTWGTPVGPAQAQGALAPGVLDRVLEGLGRGWVPTPARRRGLDVVVARPHLDEARSLEIAVGPASNPNRKNPTGMFWGRLFSDLVDLQESREGQVLVRAADIPGKLGGKGPTPHPTTQFVRHLYRVLVGEETIHGDGHDLDGCVMVESAINPLLLTTTRTLVMAQAPGPAGPSAQALAVMEQVRQLRARRLDSSLPGAVPGRGAPRL